VIRSTDRLRALDRRWERDTYGTMSYREALARYSALWAEARTLRDDLGQGWEDELEPALAIARAVNGLPPA